MSDSSQITKIPCEFARDCLTLDGEHCPKFPDPEKCGKYHSILVLEDEETYEEFQAWLSKNKPCWGVGNDDEKKCHTCEMSEGCQEEAEARAERSCP